MTIRISSKHTLIPALEQNGVSWISEERAEHQDIRPLRIGILNIMPQAETYEFNLLAPMGRSILQIVPVWIRLESHRYESSDREHLDRHYLPYSLATAVTELDGLIVTGAPVEELDFEKVTYWPEICDILDSARRNVASILGICWGGLALAKYIGIEKTRYPKKLFGVYPTRRLVENHPLVGGLDDLFLCPQSRHAGIEDAVLEQAEKEGRVRLLAKAEKGGYAIFETPDHSMVMHLGHQEYNSGRILAEAERDRQRGRADVDPLENVEERVVINNWRANRNEFFSSWIKYVYLTTPFDKRVKLPQENAP